MHKITVHTYAYSDHFSRESIFSIFFNYEPLSQLMQGAGMAVLTLLISFAIGIFIHHLSDGQRKGNFLDLHVALDYVWRFKLSVALLLIVVIAPFLISIENLIFQATVFVIWLAALIGLLVIIFRLYEWVKGDKNDFRRNYLADFPKSRRDKVVSWVDLWSSDTNADDRYQEKDFFVPFSRDIDSLLISAKKEDWELLVKLLEGYSTNIENRNQTFLVVFPEFFPKILEWHFLLWKKQYSEYAKDKPERATPDQYLFEADHIVDSIIRHITKISLSGQSTHAFSYFKTLDEHTQKYGSEFIDGEKHRYLYPSALPIYTDCFELIPKSSDSFDIWGHYFPSSWKVTIANLKDSIMARIWLDRFIHWSQSRLWKEGDGWDQELEELSRELFPSVDPITWAKIYTFALRPWSKSRVKSIVEKGTNFGLAGRVVTGWGDDAEKNLANIYESELQSTLDLAMHLFGSIFTKDNLDAWLNELQEFNYPEDSSEFRRKQNWEGIFKALKKRLDDNRGS